MSETGSPPMRQSESLADFGAVVPGEHHIELQSGRYLDLANPDPEVISLGDVAHGLANTCRFAGHARRFYSVAEHTVLVARRLRVLGHDPLTQWCGLHHDDAEAFIGDLTRPLKALLGDRVKAIEWRVFDAVRHALDLPWDPPTEVYTAVKDADNWALACEAFHLLPSKGATWFCADLYDPDERPAPSHPVGFRPEVAMDSWLSTHHALTAEIAEANRVQ